MSSAAENPSNFPTMIIPKGTEIRINDRGQLSIRTPGNLVIQNSGNYSEIESTNGSIRIEENVNVEAVSVRASQACFIQGTLTAWKVQAKRITLEERAKAYIMLQESEQLELAKNARLIGNFTDEKEIYLLLGKFGAQLKELPAGLQMHESRGALDEAPSPAPASASAPTGKSLPPQLAEALSLLEGELEQPTLSPQAAEAVREVVFALRASDLTRAKLIHEDLASVAGSSDPIRRASEILRSYFA